MRHPPAIIAIGRNYAEHAAETGSKLPDKPLIFSIFPSAVLDPGGEITWSESLTKEVDWEVELAVVIGKRARKVSEEDALKHVFATDRIQHHPRPRGPEPAGSRPHGHHRRTHGRGVGRPAHLRRQRDGVDARNHDHRGGP
jgi:hypothetical protein